ncbi:Glutathione import ATP-binding protein GsiA [Streptomyces sp. YIM 130001]|uniref:ABC transporter ATP-binding protein n=1 Tax=Streptomyces sp. YIM 130001 TaxID=2259644 RepID=UPI000E65DE65|nr:ATP-binding cassette domain-containing protein [Streptomyces sp. YIM 130001]RII20377.1 Glutathione import ATP-binding protein GsiA [Streptomyces sp. YIM 130001]
MNTPVPQLLNVPEISAHADGAPRPLLDRIALTVEPGVVLAVAGPSGSGKTTLGLAVLGAARSGVELDGQARLEGTDLLRLTPAARTRRRAGRAAHLPQHPATVLDPVRRNGSALTELAALGHTGRAPRKAAAERALNAVGLDPAAVRRRFPHQLSGGQQQRLALASALVTGARLLVLDEPTSGLDPLLTRDLSRTVRALADDGTGVLLLSHDLPFVRATADRVVVLDHGRAADSGPTGEVLGSGDSTERPHRRVRPRATRDLLAAEHELGDRSMKLEDPEGGTASGSEVVAQEVVVRRRSGDPLAGPVSMAFPPGSRTALLGASGSGKTTFARVLAGLTPPTSGEVRFDGRRIPARIDRRPPAERRLVQYVHQSSADSFEDHRPVHAQLADTARLLRGLGVEDATAEAVVTARALGLDETLLHRTPGRLSGGQLQRCALVRALTARPSLLICDEVTSALDTISRRRVLGALPGLLAPAGTALLFISHDLSAVRALTDRAALFEAGRCVRRGPVDGVLPAGWISSPDGDLQGEPI